MQNTTRMHFGANPETTTVAHNSMVEAYKARGWVVSKDEKDIKPSAASGDAGDTKSDPPTNESDSGAGSAGASKSK